MARSILQQANDIIEKASSLLLVVPEKASLDATASMIALFTHLTTQSEIQQNHQTVHEVSPSHIPPALQFLSGSSQVTTKPARQPEIVLDIAGQNSIAGIRHQSIHGGIRVHISLSAGAQITKDQFETRVRLLPYDAIVTIGTTDLEELGETFSKHVDFFYNTPIVNIDHRAANEHFGTVNLVDITAGSCSEVVYELIQSNNQQIPPEVATALYAGIVSGTDSFQKPSTTPRSFQSAAELIEQQADRELVIQHLVKTKPINIIKLSGTVYSRLQYESSVNLYWATIGQKDFTETRSTPADIPTVMRELLNNIAGFNAAFILYEEPAKETADSHSYICYLLIGKGLSSRRHEIQQTLSAKKENGALLFRVVAPTRQAAESATHDKIKQILP